MKYLIIIAALVAALSAWEVPLIYCKPGTTQVIRYSFGENNVSKPCTFCVPYTIPDAK